MSKSNKLLLGILVVWGITMCALVVNKTKGQSYTTSKSMIGSAGSFSTAGFTINPYTWTMANSAEGGFTANITSNAPQLLQNGGVTSIFCGSFLFANASTSQTVTLFLDSGGTKTEAFVRAGHSVAIDGAPSTLYAQSSTNLYPTCTNATASCSNANALCSWAFVDY